MIIYSIFNFFSMFADAVTPRLAGHPMSSRPRKLRQRRCHDNGRFASPAKVVVSGGDGDRMVFLILVNEFSTSLFSVIGIMVKGNHPKMAARFR